MTALPGAARPGTGPPALLVGLHLCVGAPLLIAPGTLLGNLPNERVDRRARGLARVLGARHLAEAAILAARHTHDWIRAGAAVDATHAASMLLLAWLRPAQRELALSSAAGATLLALCSAHYDQRERPTCPGYAETGG